MNKPSYFCRVLVDGRPRYGVVDGDSIELLQGEPWASRSRTVTAPGSETISRASAKLLVPLTPSKILCAGRNYRAHAKELGNEVPVEPMMFYKPPSSLLAHEGEIELPPAEITARVEHEAELGVVVGERLRRASLDEARDAIFGLTIVCDVTARDLQKKDGQWWRAKGADTFCPVGPYIVTDLDPAALTITCRVNDQVRQHGKTSDMIFGVAELLSFVSQVVTLEPGDLVVTGTPEGVGPLAAGDLLEVEIPPIGVLRCRVRASS